MKKPASRQHGKRVSTSHSKSNFMQGLPVTATPTLLARAMDQFDGGLFALQLELLLFLIDRVADFRPNVSTATR